MFSQQSSNSAEYITNRSQISSILRRLRQENPLLSVHFPGDNKLYNSSLLTVDAVAGALSLDELNPAAGHERVAPGTKLRVQGLLNGVDVRFTATVTTVDQDQGIYFYLVKLPEELLYRQRRDHLRVPLATSRDTVIELQSSGQVVKARISDISVAGFGAVILEGEGLASGQRFDCSFELGSKTINANVEIRFVVEDGHRRRLGARFHNLSPSSQRHLERTVMQLQRELVRVDEP